MKTKKLGVLLALFLITFGSYCSYANERDSVKVEDMIESSLQREEYYSLYAKIPSLLRLWDNPDYSIISLKLGSSQGDYTHPQLLSSKKLLTVHTESIKSMPKKGWRFYGSVAYSNGNASTGKWNMSYYLPTNGSPYYYMIEQKGTWKMQSYLFNVSMQKDISNRLSVGLSLKYLGDLTFRTFDSRNDNTTLEMEMTPSVTLRMGNRDYLSTGLFVNRVKNESSISNKYQHGDEPEKYHLFFNEGMGTWDNSPSVMRMMDVKYGFFLSWRRVKESCKLDVVYRAYLDQEEWKLMSISTLLDMSLNITKYSSFNHELLVRYINKGAFGNFRSVLDVKNILGIGNVYNDNAGRYIDNYEATIINANLYAGYVKNNYFLKHIYANFNFQNSSANDYNYGHTLSYNNLESSVGIDLLLRDKSNLNFIAGPVVSFKKFLTGEHSPMAAATNFYNTAIAMPAFAFLTTDSYKVGAKFGVQLNMSNQNRLELLIKGDFVKPISINNYLESATFSKKDNYFNLSVAISLNF